MLATFPILLLLMPHDGKIIKATIDAEEVKTEVMIKDMEYKDHNDYAYYPLCGDIPMQILQDCLCGNLTLSGLADLKNGDFYCCVPPSPSGHSECQYTGPGKNDKATHSDVRCKNGQVKEKTQTCHKQCWNPYRESRQLFTTATLHCKTDDFCLQLRYMCNGVCEEEAELCDADKLRCVGDGFGGDLNDLNGVYNIKSLDTKLGKGHGYCFREVNNDQAYDSITREDEDRILGRNERAVNYTLLKKCKNKYGTEGIQCQNGCKGNYKWYNDRGDVCPTVDGPVSWDNPELCRNNTFWTKINLTCDVTGDYSSFGARCTGVKKHCFWPWYLRNSANVSHWPIDIICLDNSDQVFPINTTCSLYNNQFLETYKSLWCNGVVSQGLRCDGGDDYNSLEDWYFDQNNKKIRDPHGCQKSCETISASAEDCVACKHPNFFHCVSTGVCIHKTNECDGHPHPACGGDDEGLDHCGQKYFKRRIVKNYATLVCPSKMYPGK